MFQYDDSVINMNLNECPSCSKGIVVFVGIFIILKQCGPQDYQLTKLYYKQLNEVAVRKDKSRN